MIIKFTSWQARDTFFNARNRTNYRVFANLTKRNADLLQYAEKAVADADNDSTNLINFVFVDRNCRLMAFTKQGRFLSFNTKTEFDLLLNKCDNVNDQKIYEFINEDLS